MTAVDATLAIGFVTFNPGETFFDRLRALTSLGYKVYVFDNSPEYRAVRDVCKPLCNVHYSTAGKNVGLGFGLSVIAATSYYDGYAAQLFFDQDTIFTSQTLEFISEFHSACSPIISERYVAVVFNAREESSALPFQIKDVLLAISSGSLFVLENLKKIGWHNAKYFVDGVDYELCLRARTNGYRIGSCSNTPGFDHESEQPDRFVEIFKRRLPLRNYSGTRIVDSIRAYLRLIAFALKNFDFQAAGAVARSFLIFLLGQVLARTIVKKAI